MENQNEALEDLSRMFVDNPDNPTPGSELKDATQFDFTLESLSAMDDHIDAVRTHELSDDQWNSFILRAGAYVGEVIRKLARPEVEWTWLSHEQAADINDFLASHEMSIGTAAVLWDGSEGIAFPLGKVAKFIANGREDSVHFYAQVIVTGAPNAG